MGMRSSRPLLPWAVWGVAVLLYAFAVINRSSLAALGPATQEHFSIDASTLAAFPVIQLVVYAACQIPVGLLLDRFGASVMLISGSLLMMVGQVVMGTVSEVWLAILARVLVGAGDACVFISVMRMLPEWFSPRQLPTLSQLTGLIGQAGQLVSVTPLVLIVKGFGWSAGFLGIAAVGLLLVLVGLVMLRDAPGRRAVLERMIGRTGKITRMSAELAGGPVTSPITAPPATSSIPIVGGRRAQERSAAGQEAFFTRVRRLLWIPGVRLAFWVHFVSAFASHAFLLLWGTPFLTGGLGMSTAEAAGLLSLTIVSSMVVGFVLGPICSRFAHRRVWIVVGLVGLIAVTWAAILLWPGMPPLWLVIVLVVVVPIGGPVSMIAFDVARSHTPRSFAGFGTGLVNTGGFIAALTLVMLIGIALDLQGAGSPETYSLHAFKVAFTLQYPIWALGLTMVLVERRRTLRWMDDSGRTL